MFSMKTTSLSVAYKKHIYNQKNHLKSEDTSAILALVRNNIDAIQTTTHMDDSEFWT